MEKCCHCKKKTLIIVNCNCEKKLCLSCKYPDKHNCDFNFKEKAKKDIEKKNPKVVKDKLLRI